MGDQALGEDGSAAAAAVSGLLVADLLPDLRRNQSYSDGGGGGGPPTPSSVEAQEWFNFHLSPISVTIGAKFNLSLMSVVP